MPQLRTYTVQAPDGRTITLEGPEGAPQDEVIRRAQSMYQQQYGGVKTKTPDRLAVESDAKTAKYPLKGVERTGSTFLPELLGETASILQAPFKDPVGIVKGVVKQAIGYEDPMNIGMFMPAAEEFDKGRYSAATAKLLAPVAAAGITAGAVKGASPVAGAVRRTAAKVAPTPEGLMQRATANRVAADVAPPSGLPVTKTGVIVNAAKRIVAPARRGMASAQERLANYITRNERVDMGQPEVGSAAFLTENIKPPADVPPSMYPGGIPRTQGWGRGIPEYEPSLPQVGATRPISRDALGQPTDDFVSRLRALESPDEAYAREVARRNVEFQPEPTQTQPLVGATRPDAQPVPLGGPSGLQRVMVEVGGEIPKNQLLEFHPTVQALADAFGGASSTHKMATLQKVINEALPDLKRSQVETVRTPLNTNDKIALAARDARNRVWDESIAPSIQGQVDITPIGERMIAEIPTSIRVLDNAAYKRLVAQIQAKFRGKSIPAQGLHALAKEASAGVRSAMQKNNFDRQAALGTTRGQQAFSYNEALRDFLWKHVEDTTGVDVRPALSRYGALSEVEQAALKLPKADYSNIANAIDQYQLDMAKTTPPFNPQRFMAPAPEAVRQGRLLTAGEPTRPNISMGDPIVQLESGGPSVTRANSLPLPMNESRLNYGAGYNQPAYENFQYTGEVPPAPPLRQPSGPGVLKSSSVFPKSPKSGDRFRYNNETYIYTRNGWVPYVKPKTSTPKRSLPPLDEP